MLWDFYSSTFCHDKWYVFLLWDKDNSIVSDERIGIYIWILISVYESKNVFGFFFCYFFFLIRNKNKIMYLLCKDLSPVY